MSSGLIETPKPPLYQALWQRTHEGPNPVDPETASRVHLPSAPGFKDVIPGDFATGSFYNHPMGIHQLFVALAVSPHHDRIQEIVAETEGSGMRNLMTTFRSEQVLADMKVGDLGSGTIPGLALAAGTMGAEAHTFDIQDLDPDTKRLVASHTVVDLSEPQEALTEIRETAGDEFDFVTANIISSASLRVTDRPRLPLPSELRHYGEQMLRGGGYYFDSDSAEGDLFQKQVVV